MKKGKISITAKLRKTGYVPGGSIALQVDIVNGSSQKINQDPRAPRGYIAAGTPDTREVCRDILRAEEKLEIRKGETKTISRNLQIPPTVATMTSCPIMSIQYFLRV
ncbi:hypothetical protein PMAYCL1PPCAC_19515, partial [Pristionchus mayeri]